MRGTVKNEEIEIDSVPHSELTIQYIYIQVISSLSFVLLLVFNTQVLE